MWYFRCGIVSLNLRKEYLNMTIFKIPVLLLINSWTFWCIKRLHTSSYTGVTYFQKWSVFWPPHMQSYCLTDIQTYRHDQNYKLLQTMHMYYVCSLHAYRFVMSHVVNFNHDSSMKVELWCTSKFLQTVINTFIDHPRSGMVYNFGRVCMFVCMSVRQ